jgi:hypothetical protein
MYYTYVKLNKNDNFFDIDLNSAACNSNNKNNEVTTNSCAT